MRKIALILVFLLLGTVFSAALIGCGAKIQMTDQPLTAKSEASSASVLDETAQNTSTDTSSETEIIPETQAVSITEEIAFYYPRMNETDVEIELVYKKISTEIDSEEGYVEILTSFFRNPPAEGLLPIMSQNTVINAVSLDPVSGVVTIDFAASFVTEMNAGSAAEAAILRSVTNTVGGIYKAEEVLITLDQQLYESGHMALDTNETFKVDLENVIELK